MYDKINEAIMYLEREHNVTALSVSLIGSRLYGYATEDSDYDIRVIWSYNDVSRYIGLDNQMAGTEIQLKGEGFEIAGWDIRRFFSHARKGYKEVKCFEYGLIDQLGTRRFPWSSAIVEASRCGQMDLPIYLASMNAVNRDLLQAENTKLIKPVIQAMVYLTFAKTKVPPTDIVNDFSVAFPDEKVLQDCLKKLIEQRKITPYVGEIDVPLITIWKLGEMLEKPPSTKTRRDITKITDQMNDVIKSIIVGR